MTDMDSVISILKCNNIDDILHFDNILKDKEPTFNKKNTKIHIKSLSHCISIHDISINTCDKDIYDFIDTYKRRYNRIIDLIKSNKKLYFIRLFGFVNNHTKNTFIQTIKNINPDCNFTLVSINLNRNSNSINKSEHFLEINVIDQRSTTDWTQSHLDWTHIFYNIQNNV